MKTKLFSKIILFFLALAFLSLPSFLVGERKHQKSTISPFHKTLAPYRKNYPLSPGTRFLVLRKWKSPDVIWYWPHNDEYSARINTYWAYRHFGGFALFFFNAANKYRRNLSFIMPHVQRFILDPNRMFEKEGILPNLQLLNKSSYLKKFPHKVLQYTWLHIGKKARRILLKYWSPKRPLIALHNNRYLNIARYREDPQHFEVAEFKNNPTSTFVFVLTKTHFEKLRDCGVNTIYQKTSQKDGSLSDFSIDHKLPYVNVETRIYYPDEQKRVIEQIMYALFPDLFPKKELLPPCETDD